MQLNSLNSLLLDVNSLKKSHKNYARTEKIRKSEKKAKFSFALAILPIVLVFFCTIIGSISEESSGIGWLMIIYYWTIGIPIAIVSLILGIISYKNQKNKLALWSIVIDILPFLIFFVLLLI